MISKTILVGRIGSIEGKDVNDNFVANFSVATSEKWTDKQGEKHENTEWSRCVCWGATARNIVKYCDKGSLVYLEGQNQTRKWQDKDGNDRYTTEVKVNKVQFLDTKSETTQVKNYASPEVLNASEPMPF